METEQLLILDRFKENYGFNKIEDLKSLKDSDIFESITSIGESITDTLLLNDIQDIFMYARDILDYEILYDYINEKEILSGV